MEWLGTKHFTLKLNVHGNGYYQIEKLGSHHTVFITPDMLDQSDDMNEHAFLMLGDEGLMSVSRVIASIIKKSRKKTVKALTNNDKSFVS